MGFWGQSQPGASHYIVILDIGTMVVKALCVYIEDNEVVIAGRHYVAQNSGSMRGGWIVDLPQVAATCRAAIAGATENLPSPPTDLVVGINGQLVEGVTNTVHYDRTNFTEPLELAELKNIIYRIQQRSHDKLRDSLRERFDDQHPEVELVHASVVDVQFDGYTVDNPVGFQGKRLSLTVFNAYVPLIYISVLQNLARLLELRLISIATQPYGLSKLLATPLNPDTEASTADHKAAQPSGIFIDIGGATTDVVIVRNGCVEGMQSFALGGQAFTDAIGTELKIPPSKSEAMKLAYTAGELPASQATKVASSLEPAVAVWIDGVALCLSEFPPNYLLPTEIYLTGGSADLPDLLTALRSKTWMADLSFSHSPKASLIDSDEVLAVADETESTWISQDLPSLGLAKLLLNFTAEHDLVAKTLQSIIRSMRHE